MFTALWLATAVPGAVAQGATAEDPYKQTIRHAITEFNAGSWHEARVLFKRAHELSPSGRTWLGMGLAAYELRLYVEATQELEAALADTRKPLSGSRRKEVEMTLDKARAFVPVYRLRVPPGTEAIVVDGTPRPVPVDAQLRLNPGEHIVAVRLDGRDQAEKQVRAVPGGRGELVFEPTADVASVHVTAGPASGALEAPASNAPAATEAGGRLWTWVAAGAAGAFLATGVTFGLLANGEFDAVDQFAEGCSPNCEVDDIRSEQADGKTFQTLSNVSYGLAGAAAIGAVVLFVVEGDAEQPTVALGPAGVQLRGSF